MNNFYSSPNMVIYTLHNLTILLLDLEKKMFEKCMVLALWGPPPGPHGGHTYYLNNFESPTPKDDFLPSLVKIQPLRFQEEDENVKSLRTTHDGRRTKTDGNSSLEPSAQVS